MFNADIQALNQQVHRCCVPPNLGACSDAQLQGMKDAALVLEVSDPDLASSVNANLTIIDKCMAMNKESNGEHTRLMLAYLGVAVLGVATFLVSAWVIAPRVLDEEDMSTRRWSLSLTAALAVISLAVLVLAYWL
jgi:hypothetical protein